MQRRKSECSLHMWSERLLRARISRICFDTCEWRGRSSDTHTYFCIWALVMHHGRNLCIGLRDIINNYEYTSCVCLIRHQAHWVSVWAEKLAASQCGASAMPTNRVQFQRGMSMQEFMDRYGTESQCADALERARWPAGFRCPRCEVAIHYRVRQDARILFQCRGCRHQTSLTAGTMIDSTKLPLRVWFLAMYRISQAKTGISALSLMRELGVSYRSAWLINQKIMVTMAQNDEAAPLQGDVLVDDAYLGGELPGVGGRGSPNKVPFVAAVSLDERGRPMGVKMSPVKAFTTKAITDWACKNLRPGTECAQ